MSNRTVELGPNEIGSAAISLISFIGAEAASAFNQATLRDTLEALSLGGAFYLAYRFDTQRSSETELSSDF
jgi:hypothetical protein